MPFPVETSVVGTILVSMATCWLVFAVIGPIVLRVIFPAYGKLNSDKRIVTNNAFLAMCHGAVVGSWLLYLFSFYSDVKQYDSKIRHICGAGFGYIIVDLLLMLKYPFISERSFILHHVMAIFLLPVGALHPGAVTWYTNIILMMELSSPFSNMRVLLYELGLRKSRAYVINGVALLVTFFLVRILPTPILCYQIVADVYVLLGNDQLSTGDLCIAIGFCVTVATICVLNFMWFRKICRGAAKVINDK